MSIVTIVGAGMMGTALSWPLADNGHTIRLVGTSLDEEIIASIQATGIHPRLKRTVPVSVIPFSYQNLEEALQGAEIVVNGVSSFGIPWFVERVAPRMEAGVPVIAVTKGLVDREDGSLQTLPDYVGERLPDILRGRVSLNAIGGPCIAHELAARRQTCVVFCGDHADVLASLKQAFATPYYHIWTSTDVTGVEMCAALKNGYALGVAIVMGLMEKTGPDGLANLYNPQAAVFAQGCYEMGRLLEIAGGNPENAVWLPGSGDLFVTVYGGRTMRLGRLIGLGHSYPDARQQLAGETLESVEIIRRTCRAIHRLEARGIVEKNEFPLLKHLDAIIKDGAPVNIPWEQFFPGSSGI